MRTTLTIDDDLAGILRERSREMGKPFKEMVNSALRAGLISIDGIREARGRIEVVSKPMHLKPGYDADKLNQLVDELEVEEFQRREARE